MQGDTLEVKEMDNDLPTPALRALPGAKSESPTSNINFKDDMSRKHPIYSSLAMFQGIKEEAEEDVTNNVPDQ